MTRSRPICAPSAPRRSRGAVDRHAGDADADREGRSTTASITAQPERHVRSPRGVVGVNPDLRVRPFFAQGGTISIREFLVGAFNAEMGLQSPMMPICATRPVDRQRVADACGHDPGRRPRRDRGAAGRPAPTAWIPTATASPTRCPSSLVDYMEFYLLNYFKPGTQRRRTTARRCTPAARCSRTSAAPAATSPTLTINVDRRVADVETCSPTSTRRARRPAATRSTGCSRPRRPRSSPSTIRARSRSLKQPAARSFVVQQLLRGSQAPRSRQQLPRSGTSTARCSGCS